MKDVIRHYKQQMKNQHVIKDYIVALYLKDNHRVQQVHQQQFQDERSIRVHIDRRRIEIHQHHIQVVHHHGIILYQIQLHHQINNQERIN
jgi:hypothetical protein